MATNKMKLITLVDIARSQPGKLFETTMSEKIYLQQKAKGKMNGWIPKDQIKSIDVTEVDSPEDAKTEVIVEEETEATPDVTESVNEDVEEVEVKEEDPKKAYSEMKKDELIAELDSRNIEYNATDKKIILIALLTEADHA